MPSLAILSSHICYIIAMVYSSTYAFDLMMFNMVVIMSTILSSVQLELGRTLSSYTSVVLFIIEMAIVMIKFGDISLQYI